MNTERVDVHSMTPQQKADYTYGKVKKLYFDKVFEAEQLRVTMNIPKLNILLNKFASEHTQQKLEQGLVKRAGWREEIPNGRKKVHVSDGRRAIDLAMAGLFRIGHVEESGSMGP